MDTEPRLPSSRFRRLISSRTSSMNAARSLLTPLLLASTASALHGARPASAWPAHQLRESKTCIAGPAFAHTPVGCGCRPRSQVPKLFINQSGCKNATRKERVSEKPFT